MANIYSSNMQFTTSALAQSSPLTYTMYAMPDIESRLDALDIHDITLFLFKHPTLAPIDRNINNPKPQTNDITKLSLKTMSDYILKFGITADEPDIPQFTVNKDQEFNSVSYTGQCEPEYVAGCPESNNRPATIRDVFNALDNDVLVPVFNELVDTNAFEAVNTLQPDYILSLDDKLNTDMLYNLTDSMYVDINAAHFIYVGAASNYTSMVSSGLVDPEELTVFIKHTHPNIIVDNRNVNVVRTNASYFYRTDNTGAGQSMSFKTTIKAGVRQYGSQKYQGTTWFRRENYVYISEAGVSALSGDQYIELNGDIEDKVNARSIDATCLENAATAPNYIPSLKKVSVRYGARCYRIFEKQQ